MTKVTCSTVYVQQMVMAQRNTSSNKHQSSEARPKMPSTYLKIYTALEP